MPQESMFRFFIVKGLCSELNPCQFIVPDSKLVDSAISYYKSGTVTL